MPTISFHTSGENDQIIRALAEQQGMGVSALVGQMVEEGLRMRRFPGIIFRSGPSGRRAALAGSLDIWEVITILQEFANDEPALLAAYPSLTPAALKIARAYAEAYPGEIKWRIAMNSHSEEVTIADLPALFAAPLPSPARRSGQARRKSSPGG